MHPSVTNHNSNFPLSCLFASSVNISLSKLSSVHLHHTVCLCVCLRAADWKLDAPDWTGRMRVTARGKVAYVKLEDKVSGERADRTAPLFTGAVAAVNHITV